MRVAVYTANFGNYRNELSVNNLNKVKFSKEIDYFLFTENDIKCKWNVQKVTLEKKLDFMNAYRHTNKVYKFCLPKILYSYDYVIWTDTKALKNINNLSLDKIKSLVTNTNKSIFLIKHHKRVNPLQELNITLKKGMEKRTNVDNFKNKIQNIKFNSQLPDLMTFLRKVDDQHNKCFTEIYNIELKNKLCRDQNIIQYAFYVTGYESKLFYFKSDKVFRNKLTY